MRKRWQTKNGDVQKENKEKSPLFSDVENPQKGTRLAKFWGSFWLPSVMPCCKAWPFHQQSQLEHHPQLISLIFCFQKPPPRNRSPFEELDFHQQHHPPLETNSKLHPFPELQATPHQDWSTPSAAAKNVRTQKISPELRISFEGNSWPSLTASGNPWKPRCEKEDDPLSFWGKKGPLLRGKLAVKLLNFRVL